MFVPASDPKLVERIVAQTKAMPKDVAIDALESTWGYDAAEALDQLKLKVCAINGNRFPTNVEGNRRHAPSYQALIQKGVGHYLMLERPEDFDRLLAEALAFLAVP